MCAVGAATERRRGPDPGSERFVYIFLTAVLALLISGFGAGIAFGCRMDPGDEGH